MGHNYWARSATTEACTPRVYALQKETPQQKEGYAPQQSSPRVPQRERAPHKATRTKRGQNNNNFKGSQGKRNGNLPKQQQKPLFLLLAGFHQKLYGPGGSGMTFSKDCKVKTVTQEFSIQQSYHSDVKEKYFPRQIIIILNVNGLNSPIKRQRMLDE